MKRIFTMIFISMFALAFSAGFVACKKDKPAEEPAVEQTEEAAPAAEEAKPAETK